MTSLDRPLTGPLLVFRLAEWAAQLRADDAYARSGRAGRTLAKSGPLRVVLVALANGTVVGTHRADGPMTVHVLEGGLRFRAGGEERHLTAGEVLFFGPGDAHDIRAERASLLLLTLAEPLAEGA